jgi:hypothetical protein
MVKTERERIEAAAVGVNRRFAGAACIAGGGCEVTMPPAGSRIQRFGCFQQPDRRGGIVGFGLDPAGLAGFQMNRTLQNRGIIASAEGFPPAGALSPLVYSIFHD